MNSKLEKLLLDKILISPVGIYAPQQSIYRIRISCAYILYAGIDVHADNEK